MPLATSQNAAAVGPTVGPLTDLSGTVTSGGVAQQVAVANPNRRYLLVQNQSNAVLNVEFGAVATAASIALKACGTAGDGSGGSIAFECNFIPTGTVSILGANTGQQFTVKEG